MKKEGLHKQPSFTLRRLLLFAIITTTSTASVTTGNFNTVKTTVTAIGIVLTFFYVASNRIVSVHNFSPFLFSIPQRKFYIPDLKY